MFEIASKAATHGKGVVGSTSNILNFIVDKAMEPFERAADSGAFVPKRFLLGTEAGMVTGIVNGVQAALKEVGEENAGAVEIVFPVAAEAVAQVSSEGGGGTTLIPGVKGGEGCSTAGG